LSPFIEWPRSRGEGGAGTMQELLSAAFTQETIT
jgi:hypothetical protein